MRIQQIGKGGLHTSFIVKKSLLKKLFKGGTIENCQENINNAIDNPESPKWLQITSILQNIKGKGIATILGKINSTDVIVKTQLTAEMTKEYDMQDKLKDIQGFIKYDCTFTCNGTKEYIENFAYHGDKTRLCNTKGTTMGVIIMPYYKNGSLEEYLKKNTDKEKIKTIIIDVIKHIADAYTKIQFTHGDLFTKNIVLDDNYNPIIIDFEKSVFDKSLTTFWRDIDDFFGDISRYIFRNEVDIISRVIMINRAYGIEPSEKIIEDLIYAVKNL